MYKKLFVSIILSLLFVVLVPVASIMIGLVLMMVKK